jgi:hypothetical protein
LLAALGPAEYAGSAFDSHGNNMSQPATAAASPTVSLCNAVQHFGYNASSPLAVALPAATSGAQVAAFAIASVDASDVTLTCMLQGSGAVQPLLPAPGFSLNQEFACERQQVFSVTSAGKYEFSVRGTDAVSNFQQKPTVHAFSVSYAVGQLYAITDGAPWGLSSVRAHTFELRAVAGTADGVGAEPSTDTTFEASIAQLSAAKAGGMRSWTAAPWAAANTSQFTFTVRAGATCDVQAFARASSRVVGTDSPVTHPRTSHPKHASRVPRTFFQSRELSESLWCRPRRMESTSCCSGP